MTALRVAIVGGGAIARAHVAAMRAMPVCFPDAPSLQAVLVCDATPELAEAAAARLGIAESVSDWQDSLARPDIDAVIVATPPDLHAEVAVAALRSGKHVLCEKPLARTTDEAATMVQAAQQAGRVAMVGFVYRQAPALLQARKLVEEGALGEIVHATGRYFQDFGRDASRPAGWRHAASRAGAGALADIGSHLVDCLSWLVGPLVSVSGAHRTVITARPRLGGGELAQVDVDDLGTFVGRFEAGALGTFEVSQVATGRKNELRIELNGTRGSLAFDWERANELQYLSADDAPDRFGFRTILAGPQQPGFTGLLPVAGLGVGFLDAFITQAASFACAIAGQQPVGTLASFADGQRVVQVIQAVLESARTRHWVDVAPT